MISICSVSYTHLDVYKRQGYNGSIQQLWSGRQNRGAWPTDGAKYVDSLETYLNHLDPFEPAMTMYFRRACPFRNAEGLGMMLCSFPDLEITDPRNQVLQTPVYAGKDRRQHPQRREHHSIEQHHEEKHGGYVHRCAEGNGEQ